MLYYDRMDMTTEDSVTPIFTVSTTLRTVNATGDSVTEAYVGDILYWTIDIPCKYCYMEHIWAAMPLGFQTKPDSKQYPQLQRLSRKLKFRLKHA